MRRFFAILFTMLFLCLGLNAQEPKKVSELKKLKPLISKQKDVENIYGEPSNETNLDNTIYLIKGGKLYVRFSSGKCSSDSNAYYDVERGTVIEILLILENPIKLSKLMIENGNFKVFQESDVTVYHYTDYERGISFRGARGKINQVKIFPSEKQHYLLCAKSVKD